MLIDIANRWATNQEIQTAIRAKSGRVGTSEGFEPIALEAAIGEVHQYFLSAVNEYEVKIAAAMRT